MQKYLQDSDKEAYSTKYFKQKLQEKLKDEIVFAEINGLHDAVTFRMKVSKILNKF